MKNWGCDPARPGYSNSLTWRQVGVGVPTFAILHYKPDTFNSHCAYKHTPPDSSASSDYHYAFVYNVESFVIVVTNISTWDKIALPVSSCVYSPSPPTFSRVNCSCDPVCSISASVLPEGPAELGISILRWVVLEGLLMHMTTCRWNRMLEWAPPLENFFQVALVYLGREKSKSFKEAQFITLTKLANKDRTRDKGGYQ